MDFPLHKMQDTTVGCEVHEHSVKDFEGILPKEYLPHKAETVNDGCSAGLQKIKQALKKNCQRNLQMVSCI